MVFSVGTETETPPERMATKKPHPLHNFSMPVLKWGNQRHLRCKKVNPNGQISATSPDRRSLPSDAESADRSSPNCSGSFRRPSTPSSLEKLLKPALVAGDGSSDAGIEEIRAKLLNHLRTAADQMRFKVPGGDAEEEESSALRPWNLRTRRAACKAPAEKHPPPAAAPVVENPRSLRLRGSAAAAATAAAQIGEKKEKEKEKLSISLSREEVEEDFFILTGSKPSRRPKKRAKIIQRQLDAVFPGLWLSEITPDSYKVPEFPESGKR